MFELKQFEASLSPIQRAWSVDFFMVDETQLVRTVVKDF